jgi:hypothetical protein
MVPRGPVGRGSLRSAHAWMPRGTVQSVERLIRWRSPRLRRPYAAAFRRPGPRDLFRHNHIGCRVDADDLVGRPMAADWSGRSAY